VEGFIERRVKRSDIERGVLVFERELSRVRRLLVVVLVVRA